MTARGRAGRGAAVLHKGSVGIVGAVFKGSGIRAENVVTRPCVLFFFVVTEMKSARFPLGNLAVGARLDASLIKGKKTEPAVTYIC